MNGPRTESSPASAEVELPRPRYRHDIDGLRALAVLLVVVYHIWLGRVSGGVDVFLMISAFFITDAFLRRMKAGASFDAGRFWLRRFFRLLPAAVVTLLGVLAATYALYPETMWRSIWQQTWGSLLYVQNWVLVSQEVDYYARTDAVQSPLQHFWSLSVQGQVMIVWPIILVAVAAVVRRTRVSASAATGVAFGLVFATSLAYSIYTTATNQAVAYFDTGARLWEFAAGSLVAVILPAIRLPRGARVILGWAGIVGIVSCGLVLDVAGGFPGYFALWPVLSTAAVIIAGTDPARGSPRAMLGSWPFRALGRTAYALYLVHWPVLITVVVVNGSAEIDVVLGLIVMGISLALAIVLHLAIENPLRKWAWVERSRVRLAVAVLLCVAIVAAPLVAWQEVARRADQQVELITAQADTPYLGGAVIDGVPAPTRGPTDPPFVPIPTALEDEWVVPDSRCRGDLFPAQAELRRDCWVIAADDEDAPRIVVAGDSHAQQWMAALIPIAQARGWDLVAVLKGGCPYASKTSGSAKNVRACAAWNGAVTDYIADLNPELVFLMATAAADESPREKVIPGLSEIVGELVEDGRQVIAVRDNPRFDIDMYGCIIDNGVKSPMCTREVSEVLATTNPAARVSEDGQVLVADFTDYLCPDDTCMPVIGNVAVYLDDNHVTESFAASLAPALDRMLRESEIGERPVRLR